MLFLTWTVVIVQVQAKECRPLSFSSPILSCPWWGGTGPYHMNAHRSTPLFRNWILRDTYRTYCVSSSSSVFFTRDKGSTGRGATLDLSRPPRQRERVQGVGGNVTRLVPSPPRIVLKKTFITIFLLQQERNLSNFKTIITCNLTWRPVVWRPPILTF